MHKKVTSQKINRRQVLAALAGGVAATSGLMQTSGLAQTDDLSAKQPQKLPDRPNILWLFCEDMSPDMGCYGDSYAVTPNLDQLAQEGLRYTNAFSVAAVCSPSRSGLITGVYPSTLGTEHQRIWTELPEQIIPFPALLRQVGYYCVNPDKEDYNFVTPKGVWDASGEKATYHNRKPGQPFFQITQFGGTHDSQMRRTDESHESVIAHFTNQQRHDPKKVPWETYYPENLKYFDASRIHQSIAQCYDNITLMDLWVGKIIQQIKDEGLYEDTIIMFFSDHGGGQPRHKGFMQDTGIRVPLLVRIPEKYRHLAPAPSGSTIHDMVSFVDFATAMLNLAQMPIPAWMQGQKFLGANRSAPRSHVYAVAGRAMGQLHMARAVRSSRFKYYRDYMPYSPYSKTGRAGEYLFDLENDPKEINNLVDAPEYRETLEQMRKQLSDWMKRTRDLGFLPESVRTDRIAELCPYDLGLRGESVYPMEEYQAAADLLLQGPSALSEFESRLSHEDPVRRFWAAQGILNLGRAGLPAVNLLEKFLTDPNVDVQLVVADALGRLDRVETIMPTLAALLKHESSKIRVRSLCFMKRYRKTAIKMVADQVKPLLKDRDRAIQMYAENILSDGKKFDYLP